MTAFEELERGDIVWATDPLSEKGRPMLVLGTPQFPNHGVQLITVLISTKTYHEESVTLRDHDYAGDPLGERSHVLPWSLATLNSAEDIKYYLTSLVDDRTEDVASQVIGYISS
ncbi:type II toxin-antitoxin system PemK/MazF family toxin [Haloferax sp. Q22]|uniref:type II toxin-antitoxin system PemK/MazF family toxin n=1 Tax=Haloferax sp. (strain Q22) TaxID=1526048 RepID=UPI000737B121|nr:type II toxin-antitoxin system PemK/MazF family toxin [Haloferax sp. Q22]